MLAHCLFSPAAFSLSMSIIGTLNSRLLQIGVKRASFAWNLEGGKIVKIGGMKTVARALIRPEICTNLRTLWLE
jgi:hypothetical protein